MDSSADGNAGKPSLERAASFDNSPTSPSAFTRQHVQAAQGPWQQAATATRTDAQFSFIEEHEDSRRLLPALFAGSDSYGNTQFGGLAAGSSTWDSKLSYLSAVCSDIEGIPLGSSGTASGHLQANSLAVQMSGGPVHTIPVLRHGNAGLDYAESALEHMQAHIGGDVSSAKMMMLSQPWGRCPVDPSTDGLPAQVLNFNASSCLPSLPADPGFAERAAKFSAFSNMGFPESSLGGDANKDCNIAKLNLMKPFRQLGRYTTKQSAHNSPSGFDSKSLENLRFSTKEPGSALPMEEFCKGVETHSSFLPTANVAGECNEGGQKQVCLSVNESDESMGHEVSSSCGLASMHGLLKSNARKRKAGSQILKDGEGYVNNPKDVDPDDDRPKCLGVNENTFEHSLKPQEQSNSGNSEDSTPKSAKQASKPPEAPKPDFIHVRARRGQATDSHSLAERVRREKISERMKFLQDLVPGCSKVTGKAVMLDEIINYVQSLQRQVEFLSMKLAAVNPRLEFNVDNLFAKERPVQPRVATPASTFGGQNPFFFHPLHHHQPPHLQIQSLDQCPSREVQAYGSDPVLRRTMSTPPVMETYEDSASQGASAWDDELQSVVQMNFAQRQSAQELQGPFFQGQMKVEH